LIGDETDILKVVKVDDEYKDKITVVYSYTYEIDETSFEDRVEIDFTLGLNSENKLVVQFERIDGNLLYFKKIVNDIKHKCFGL
jgi:hypothetical protein